MPTDPHNTADRRPHRNSVLRELREMQQTAYARVQKPETEDKDVAQLLRAYVTAEQQRNVLRMRPAPKPIDVSDKRKPQRRRVQVQDHTPQALPPAPTPTPDTSAT